MKRFLELLVACAIATVIAASIQPAGAADAAATAGAATAGAVEQVQAVEPQSAQAQLAAQAAATPAQAERLPFRTSISVREGFDSNTLTSAFDESESWFTSVFADLSGRWGNDRLTLDLEAGGGFSYYYDRPGDDIDWFGNGRLSLAYNINPRTLFRYSGYMAYEAEPRFDLPLSQMRRSGDYFYTSQEFSLAYQLTERLSTVTKYSLVALLYDEGATSDLEDRLEHYIGQELRYLVRPETTVLGEYRFGIIDYFDAPRDATAHYILAGIDHTLNPKSKVSVRGGAEYREWDQQSDTDWAPYAELNLSYAYGENSSISWLNRYAIEQSDLFALYDRQTFRTGLNVRHELAGKLVASLGAYYLFSQYDQRAGFTGDGFDEQAIDLSARLEYSLSKMFAIDLGYLFTQVLADESFREYDRHRVYLGLRASF